MEIKFPIEFLVHGTPVSLQAKRAQAREEWKNLVKESSNLAIPVPHFASDHGMAVTLYYLPEERMQGDLDNIVKPIVDALSGHIYIDDHQVERILVQKFEPGNVFDFNEPSAMLAEALGGRRPVVYVRISDDPNEELS